MGFKADCFSIPLKNHFECIKTILVTHSISIDVVIISPRHKTPFDFSIRKKFISNAKKPHFESCERLKKGITIYFR